MIFLPTSYALGFLFLVFIAVPMILVDGDKPQQQVYEESSRKSSSPSSPSSSLEYVILGVSGGLQDGFPDHSKLDYHYQYVKDGDDDDEGGIEKTVPAIFLGRGLVRGYKAYLDVMQPTWRQYIDEEQDSQKQQQQPLINSVVIASGCHHHANEYWMYLVESRQLLTVLMNEPRFLSITPDLGLVDLTSEHTSDIVKHVAKYQILNRLQTTTTTTTTTNNTAMDMTRVAFPIVTAAWYESTSMVPSPIVKTTEDGTEITNFPYSLAKWVGVENTNTTTTTTTTTETTGECQNKERIVDGAETTAIPGYWEKLRVAIRNAERNGGKTMTAEASTSSSSSNQEEEEEEVLLSPPLFRCKKKARFGVSKSMARINYPMTRREITTMMEAGGYEIDYEKATIY